MESVSFTPRALDFNPEKEVGAQILNCNPKKTLHTCYQLIEVPKLHSVINFFLQAFLGIWNMCLSFRSSYEILFQPLPSVQDCERQRDDLSDKLDHFYKESKIWINFFLDPFFSFENSVEPNLPLIPANNGEASHFFICYCRQHQWCFPAFSQLQSCSTRFSGSVLVLILQSLWSCTVQSYPWEHCTPAIFSSSLCVSWRDGPSM